MLIEITGSSTDMNNLVTITAASNKRHFYINGIKNKLILRYLKLTGGDVRSHSTAPDKHGGSIYIYTGTLNIHFTTLSKNYAKEGGAICAKSNYDIKATILNIYNNSVQF